MLTGGTVAPPVEKIAPPVTDICPHEDFILDYSYVICKLLLVSFT